MRRGGLFEGRPQIYGTILDWNEKGEFTCVLEDPDRVDALRKAVGMPAFKQARQEHRDEILAEGGQPPENFKAYKKGITEWAKSVGWR